MEKKKPIKQPSIPYNVYCDIFAKYRSCPIRLRKQTPILNTCNPVLHQEPCPCEATNKTSDELGLFLSTF